MATSGSYGGYTYRVNQLIEDAALRAGIPAQMMTADLLQRSLRALNLLFAEMPNLRIYTWQQQRILIPIYEGVQAATAPVGTFNLLDCNLRTPVRLDPTLVSSASGTTANSDDDDFETKFTQNAALGNLKATFDDETSVYEIGVLWGASATVSFVVERSPDGGTTWLEVGSFTGSVADREWTWLALANSSLSTDWRIRMTSGTLNAREIYWGGLYRDVPMGVLSRSQFSQMPNAGQASQPLQAWKDRQLSVPVLRLWPLPARAYRYCHIAAYQQRMLANVVTLRETLDVPERWYESITARLAVKLCRTFEEAKKERLPDLMSQVNESMLPAISEDRDGAPVIMQPSVGYYT